MARPDRGVLCLLSILMASLGAGAQPAAPGRSAPPRAPAPARANAPIEVVFDNALGAPAEIAQATLSIDGAVSHDGPLREGRIYTGRLAPGRHIMEATIHLTTMDRNGFMFLWAYPVVLRERLWFTTFEGSPTRVELVLHPRVGPTWTDRLSP